MKSIDGEISAFRAVNVTESHIFKMAGRKIILPEKSQAKVPLLKNVINLPTLLIENKANMSNVILEGFKCSNSLILPEIFIRDD